jgi:serine/threonine protein kinase
LKMENYAEMFGSKFTEVYRVKGELGHGTYGKVLHCLLLETFEECAVKFFRKTEVNRD